jgi:hypothetical protein
VGYPVGRWIAKPDKLDETRCVGQMGEGAV